MDYKSELSKRITLLEKEGLSITSVHLGFEKKVQEYEGRSNYKYIVDNWNVTISFGGKEYTDKYSTGIGHRQLISSFIKKQGEKYYKSTTGEAKTEKEAVIAGWLKTVPPKLADVVYCLLNDASGTDEVFEDWCNNLGYDTDSRKALDLYLTCQKTRTAMIKMFGQELFDELSQLEH